MKKLTVCLIVMLIVAAGGFLIYQNAQPLQSTISLKFFEDENINFEAFCQNLTRSVIGLVGLR